VKKLGPGSGTATFRPECSCPASCQPADSSASVAPEKRQVSASPSIPWTSSRTSAFDTPQSKHSRQIASRPIEFHRKFACLPWAEMRLGLRAHSVLSFMVYLEQLQSPHVLDGGDTNFAEIVLGNSAIGSVLVDYWSPGRTDRDYGITSVP